MNSDKLQHGYARFLLTQGRSAGLYSAFKAGVEYAEGISTGIVMEPKSEIQRRIERSQEALNAPLKDTVKPAAVPDQVDDMPGMWDRSDFEGGATDCAQLSGCFNGHVLYETGDPDAPDAIKDSNGEVVLGLCKNCGAAEVELSRKCEPVKVIPNCPNVECGIYPGNWCRDCPKHRNNGRAE